MRHLPIRDAYEFALQNDCESEVAQIRAIPANGYRYATAVRRAHMIELLEEKRLLQKFFEEYWPEGLTPSGELRLERYRRRRVAYEELDDIEDGEPESDDGNDESRAFAFERDLQNFLAKNLVLLEEGLSLYSDNRGAGVEYPVDGGRIDILAEAADGRIVVIELKLARGRNRAIGQLLYYMGWVDENLNKQKPCRGILIANEIGPDLVTAIRHTDGVSLYRYDLQVAVERVESS